MKDRQAPEICLARNPHSGGEISGAGRLRRTSPRRTASQWQRREGAPCPRQDSRSRTRPVGSALPSPRNPHHRPTRANSVPAGPRAPRNAGPAAQNKPQERSHRSSPKGLRRPGSANYRPLEHEPYGHHSHRPRRRRSGAQLRVARPIPSHRTASSGALIPAHGQRPLATVAFGRLAATRAQHTCRARRAHNYQAPGPAIVLAGPWHTARRV